MEQVFIKKLKKIGELPSKNKDGFLKLHAKAAVIPPKEIEYQENLVLVVSGSYMDVAYHVHDVEAFKRLHKEMKTLFGESTEQHSYCWLNVPNVKNLIVY